MSPRLALAALILAGCTAAPPADTDTRALVRLDGSSAVGQKLLPALIDGHKRERSTLRFESSSNDSSTGIRRLLSGEIDLAAASRHVTPAENDQAKANGFDLSSDDSRHIVGVDVVAIAAHPDITLDSLTYDQVIGIFCTRAIDNWSFLGMEDRPIRALTRDASSGTRALFEDFFCGPRGISNRVESLTPDALEAALRDDPTAIAYITRSETSGKVLGLRPDAGGRPVFPTQQNIIRGAYPLYHDVYLFSRGKPTESVESFLRFITSPAGQDIVDEQGFVPLFLRPQALDEPRPMRETIHFEPGSSQPNQRSLARLQLLTSELKERAGEFRHVVLEGFTDNQEPKADELSAARAQSVADLIKHELPGIYFEIIPRGAKTPIAPNDTPYGRQRNRRVQIYLAAEEKAVPAGDQ